MDHILSKSNVLQFLFFLLTDCALAFCFYFLTKQRLEEDLQTEASEEVILSKWRREGKRKLNDSSTECVEKESYITTHVKFETNEWFAKESFPVLIAMLVFLNPILILTSVARSFSPFFCVCYLSAIVSMEKKQNIILSFLLIGFAASVNLM